MSARDVDYVGLDILDQDLPAPAAISKPVAGAKMVWWTLVTALVAGAGGAGHVYAWQWYLTP